jgi:hypothetical protein
MRNLKKFLAVLIAVVMMATMMIPAFAATPSDVVGTDYEGAVARLVAIGVLTGRPDGTFAPEESISRAEFAAVVIRALGYESVANVAKGTTKFSDVEATYWASGYINLAVSLGITKGRPDGTFGPNEKVLFEDAVTMVVRALGMDALAVAKGGYPTGYLVQGKEFTKGVKGVAGLPAMRGIVAQLVDNAKNIPIWEQSGFGASQTYAAGTETFLSRLGMAKLGEVVVAATPDNDSDLGAGEFSTVAATYEVVDGTVDVEAILGKKVVLWTNDDGKVIMAEEQASSTVAEAVYAAGAIEVDDDEYTTLAGTGALLNQKAVTKEVALQAAQDAAADETVEITLTLDGDDKVTFLNVMVFSAPTDLSDDPVVNAVKKDVKIDVAEIGGDFMVMKGDTSPKKLAIEKDGEMVDYTALEAGDVIMVASSGTIGTAATADDLEAAYIYIKATNETVSGKMTAAKPNTAAAESVRVDGTYYDTVAATNVAAFMSEDVKLTFDPNGKIFAIEATTETAPSNYAVILATGKSTTLGETVYKAKILMPNGDDVTLTVEDNADTAATIADWDDTVATFDADLLIEYTLNDDGVINKIVEGLTLPDDEGVIDTARGILDVSSINYYFKSDVVIFDVANSEIITLEDIDDESTVDFDYAFLDDGEISVIAVTNFVADSSVSDVMYAYVTDSIEIEDSKYELTIWNKDGESTLVSDTEIVAGDVIEYTLVDGEAAVDEDDVLGTAVTIDTAYSNRIKVGTDYFFFAEDMSVTFDDGDVVEEMTSSELAKDMEATIYTNNAGDIVVIIVTAR